jgi:hypothetical protein
VTAIGLALIRFAREELVYLLLFGVFANASGAIGDLYIVFRLAFEPAGTLVEDQGTGFRVFRRWADSITASRPGGGRSASLLF